MFEKYIFVSPPADFKSFDYLRGDSVGSFVF